MIRTIGQHVKYGKKSQRLQSTIAEIKQIEKLIL